MGYVQWYVNGMFNGMSMYVDVCSMIDDVCRCYVEIYSYLLKNEQFMTPVRDTKQYFFERGREGAGVGGLGWGGGMVSWASFPARVKAS